MNGGPEFRTALTDAGFPVARAEAVIRYLGENGLVPRGGRGRPPKDGLGWKASHFAVAILGFGAIQPIDAPGVAALLGNLKHTASHVLSNVRDEVGKVVETKQIPDELLSSGLLFSLSTLIELLAERSVGERAAIRQFSNGLFIRLDAGRGEASVPFPGDADNWGMDQFGPRQRNLLLPEPPRLSWGFEVKLEVEIVFIAADLLAENMAQRNGGLLPPEGEVLPGANPEGEPTTTENDNASDLPGSEASDRGDRDSNQPLSRASGQSCATEDREVGKFAQLRIPVSGWVSPTLTPKGSPFQCPIMTA
ncbi:hypothetical protein [Muricoccus aerilatus]|uniref:hypothetical protein n=1 Tax=Muricoccus aerilatus TaxID=452982 RepID=UPI0012ECB320|nr:hypothetical protein [Roseomonas aerilata]